MSKDEAAVNDTVVADTTTTDSAPVETKTTADGANAQVAENDQAIADKAVTESLSKPETDDEAEITPAASDETKSEEQPQGKGYEQRKEQLTGDITSLVAQRNALRSEVEKLNAEVYQPATEQELQDQGYSPEMAAIENFKQEQQIRDYNTQVAEKQLELRSDALSIVRDFPELSPVLPSGEPNPNYNEALGSQLDTILGQNLQVDPNTGQIIGSTIPPYQIYKLVADAAKASSEQGQLKGQQATERMLANVDSAPGAAPTQNNKEDNFLKGLLGEN